MCDIIRLRSSTATEDGNAAEVHGGTTRLRVRLHFLIGMSYSITHQGRKKGESLLPSSYTYRKLFYMAGNQIFYFPRTATFRKYPPFNARPVPNTIVLEKFCDIFIVICYDSRNISSYRSMIWIEDLFSQKSIQDTWTELDQVISNLSNNCTNLCISCHNSPILR